MKTCFRIPLRVATAALTALLIPIHAADPAGYIVHEWGTFTSVQGGDGVPLNWHGAETGELPGFVYSSQRPGLDRVSSNPWGVATKGLFPALQRMETPVIYFYADAPLRAEVTVRFPRGFITEWFPQALEIGPSTTKPDSLLTLLDQVAGRIGAQPKPSLVERFGDRPITNSLIRWSNVHVLPGNQDADLERRFPVADTANHYFAARATEAAVLRVDPLEKAVPSPEHERFLFYRGVGSFPAPLKASPGDGEEILLANQGAAPLTHLFALSVQRDQAVFQKLDQLDPSEARALRLDPAAQGLPLCEVVKEISRLMVDGLVGEGLYRAEAEAMVNTWRDSWFEEQGLRILYVLPRVWTDQILPIELNPRPRELVRVMVGRAELITPRIELEILSCPARGRLVPIASRARDRVHDRAPHAGDAVEERRLADVRAAHDGHLGESFLWHIFLLFYYFQAHRV